MTLRPLRRPGRMGTRVIRDNAIEMIQHPAGAGVAEAEEVAGEAEVAASAVVGVEIMIWAEASGGERPAVNGHFTTN